jgi:hypothetical protein
MNTYRKYCPNVFIAQCKEKQEKGDKIIVVTKYGKENEHIIHNLVGYAGTKENPLYCYSITRVDGFDGQERAKEKAEKLNNYSNNANKRSDDWIEKSNEGKDFLSLGEPIKIGHHSEKRHRNLIRRNSERFNNAMTEKEKGRVYKERALYWESMADVINLSMPESLEVFKVQLQEATEYHKELKDGTIEREHYYSLTYAKKKVNVLKKKHEIAVKLWG